MNRERVSRRDVLRWSGAAWLGSSLSSWPLKAQDRSGEHGFVVGETAAEKVGMTVLAEGGNAVDAIVAAALMAAVAAPQQTGIGGYGMSAVVAVDGGKRIAAIDGNSAAPSAMTADFFKPNAQGIVPGRINEVGWLSAGVPGVLAGLQLALDQFGTKTFGELVQPALNLAREGFPWPKNLANLVDGREKSIFQKDPSSRKLYSPNGQPLAVGETFRNPELAELLATLAKANSVEAFYRGDIAQRIADGFQKQGGLVTTQDLAAYRARLVEPLTWSWGEHTIHTAPLTAGGLSVLQMLKAMHAMKWIAMPNGASRAHAQVEAMRLAWRDRLSLLGDPNFAKVPIERLLSDEYAQASAEKILAAVKSEQRLAHQVRTTGHTGTVHLSAADRKGNFVALTLTHGQGFGACVTVEGLGLTLGHGVSRFDPRHDHPNSPGPSKRPLHNMVPTVVTHGGRPVLAVGGAGGRKIPNALLEVLSQFVLKGQPLEASLAAPRLHTEGNNALTLEKSWPADESAALQRLGYDITTGASASMSAVAQEGSAIRKGRR